MQKGPFYHIHRWQQFSWRTRWCLVEAVIALAVGRLIVRLVPFSHGSKLLGVLGRESSCPTAWAGDTERAAEISWAVTTAARYVPWRAVCLPQCFAASFMLRRRAIPYRVHFGLRKTKASERSNEPLMGHSWLEVGSVVVVGAGQLEEYAHLSSFDFYPRKNSWFRRIV